jgi:hypothetical protein
MKTTRIVLMAFIAPSMIVLPLLLTQEGHCRSRVEEKEIFVAVHDLRKEITLYNLINGLYLSQDQIVQMLAVLRKVEGVRGEYEEKTISQARHMEEIFKGIKECVARDEEIAKELAHEFHSTKKGMEDVKKGFHGKMISYQDEIKGILNENQIALLEEFRPCIIPPRDTWDSARVGQASGNTRRGERLLTQIREMDERVYQRRQSLLIERHIERVERHRGVFSNEERAEEGRRVADILARARELSDVDFEARKGNLARELREPHEEDIQSRHNKRRGGLDKLGTFLLDPKLIPILERRLTLVSSQ